MNHVEPFKYEHLNFHSCAVMVCLTILKIASKDFRLFEIPLRQGEAILEMIKISRTPLKRFSKSVGESGGINQAKEDQIHRK